ncbi:hypothetical protein D7S86_28585 [Pararobbsia silviterrae]|uniref:Uncharacterized protein n=1 Tax=Pararobbsia silviterrae TaxID=1792498 RepID=A0A494WYP3_9BURK|nr:hypothetical protein D7S86_28585 [Pararobbsia silviterrae]
MYEDVFLLGGLVETDFSDALARAHRHNAIRDLVQRVSRCVFGRARGAARVAPHERRAALRSDPAYEPRENNFLYRQSSKQSSVV